MKKYLVKYVNEATEMKVDGFNLPRFGLVLKDTETGERCFSSGWNNQGNLGGSLFVYKKIDGEFVGNWVSFEDIQDAYGVLDYIEHSENYVWECYSPAQIKQWEVA